MEGVLMVVLLICCQLSIVLAVPDPYWVLNLRRSASSSEINRSYRKLAVLIHPDKNRCDCDADEKFHILRTAYLTLKSNERRIQYEKHNPLAGYHVRRFEWHLPDCSQHHKDDKCSSSKNWTVKKLHKDNSLRREEKTRKKFQLGRDYWTEAVVVIKTCIDLALNLNFPKLSSWSDVRQNYGVIVLLAAIFVILRELYQFINRVNPKVSSMMVVECLIFMWNEQVIGDLITKEPELGMSFQYLMCFVLSMTILLYLSMNDDLKDLSTVRYLTTPLILYHIAFALYIICYFSMHSLAVKVNIYLERMSGGFLGTFEYCTQPLLFIILSLTYILLFLGYYLIAAVYWTFCRLRRGCSHSLEVESEFQNRIRKEELEILKVLYAFERTLQQNHGKITKSRKNPTT